MKIIFVVVADEKNGIGFENKLLCHLPSDLKYFKKLTTGQVILMGRKTFESIGRPLPNRRNIVVSSSGNPILGCEVFTSIQEVLNKLTDEGVDSLFVIGGAGIYKQLMPQCTSICLTRIHHTFQSDTFFPEFNKIEWKLVFQESHPADEINAFPHTFEVYNRLNFE